MKIVVLGTRGFPNVQGGVESHCQHLYPELVKLGCEVTVFTRKPYVDPYVSSYKGVKLVALNARSNKFLETILHTAWGIIRARQINPDLVHIHAIGPSMLAPFARMLGLRVVVTNHGPDYDRQKWNRFAKSFLKIAEKWGSLSANRVISISGTIAANLKNNYRVVSTVIPNGVVPPKPSDGNDSFIKEHQLERNKYILAVGRFVPEKAFHDLLEAFERSRLGDDLGWKLALVGQADFEDQYSADIRRRAKEIKNVVLAGFQSGEALEQLYRYRGIFVLPSYHEGLPIALLEALSYGPACLASDIPGNREIDLPEERYFKAGDIDALAKKLLRFAKDPATLDDSKIGADKILERYCWERIARETLEVYRQLFLPNK